jgi:hypothetical protein
MRILVLLSLLSAVASAEDARPVLAKARAAFLANQSQERYWIWTSITTRSILDRSGKAVDQFPAVTIESPIRSDGKRCNAVVAWGDGVEPYLKNASADERCKVEEEVQPVIQLEAVFESERVSLTGRTDSEITLAIHPDKVAHTRDEAKRCAASLEGSIGLDPQTNFPGRIDFTVASGDCERKRALLEDHYAGSIVQAAGGYAKGTRVHIEYTLERDKTGHAPRDFWIATRRRVIQPLPRNLTGVVISGRSFKVSSRGPDRQGVSEVTTTATEVSAESLLKFEVPK